jgi:hypothetical protein
MSQGKVKKKKKKFSGYKVQEALEQLGITDLEPWDIQADPVVPSAFFEEQFPKPFPESFPKQITDRCSGNRHQWRRLEVL